MRLITEIQIINYVITSFCLIEKAYEKIKNGLSFEKSYRNFLWFYCKSIYYVMDCTFSQYCLIKSTYCKSFRSAHVSILRRIIHLSAIVH